MEYNEVEGDLIRLALEGNFDVITHGCNCFCRMKRGIAPQMDKAFGCNNSRYFGFENSNYEGDINKLGNIEYSDYTIKNNKASILIAPLMEGPDLIVVNSYTQYQWGTELKPFDYEAFTLCMRKINHTFKSKHIGLPQIGSHLAGGDWELIKPIIKKELKDCKVTVVIFKN